jgi:hypothetical protein
MRGRTKAAFLAAAIAIGSLLLGAAPAEAAPADVITCSIQYSMLTGPRTSQERLM